MWIFLWLRILRLIVINVAAFRSSQTGINPCPWYQDGACVWDETNAGAICEDSEFSDKATLRSNSFQDPLIRDTGAHIISRQGRQGKYKLNPFIKTAPVLSGHSTSDETI